MMQVPRSPADMAMLLQLIGDVVPFRQTGPRPMNLEGGMARHGGGAGRGEVVQHPSSRGWQVDPNTVTPQARASMDFMRSPAGKYWLAQQVQMMQRGVTPPGWTSE